MMVETMTTTTTSEADRTTSSLPKRMIHCKVCAVCELPTPTHNEELWKYFVCCGRFACTFCLQKEKKEEDDNSCGDGCPICHQAFPSTMEEKQKQLRTILQNEKDPEKKDTYAMEQYAQVFLQGLGGIPKDEAEGVRWLLRAATLGHAKAARLVAHYYEVKNTVIARKDKARAKELYAQAAEDGEDLVAMKLLGDCERKVGNDAEAIQHYKMAAISGEVSALEMLKNAYKFKALSKQELEICLREYQRTYELLYQSKSRDELMDKMKQLNVTSTFLDSSHN